MPRESIIQVYRSSTAANIPTGLTAGELAANLVDRKFFVGGTNGSTITFLDASAVVTGVNGTTGNVTNVAVTNATNNFTAVQAFPNGISGAWLSIAAGATFAGGTTDFVADYPTIQGYNSSGYLKIKTVGTGYETTVDPSIVLQSGDGNIVPSASTVTISAPGSGGGGTVTVSTPNISLNQTSTLSIGANNTNVITINGVTTFPNNSVHFAQGMSANGMIVAGRGATFTSAIRGTTASFTGLVSSSGGFSGAGTDLFGNASGLTAGTSTKAIITDTNSSSTFYPVLVSGTGNVGLNIDSATTPMTYVPSTGTLTTTSVFSTNSGVSSTLSVANVQEYSVGGGLNFLTRANFPSGISASSGTFTGIQTFVHGATFQGNISAPNIVNSVYGLTGAVGLAAGTNVSLTSSGSTITISVSGLSAAASDFVAQGKLTSNFGLTSNQDNIIQFATDYDPQGWWSTSTYRLTPKVAGYYDISMGVWWGAASTTSGQNNIQGRKNGTTFAIVQNNLDNRNGLGQGFTKSVYLNGSTDYVDFTAYSSNPTQQLLNAGNNNEGCWFKAFLISNNTPPTAYVSSVNGATAAVTVTGDGASQLVTVSGSTTTFSNRQASASATGVASFSTNDFVVGTTAHVGLTGTIARTNATNNFTAVQAFPNGISSAGGATFAGNNSIANLKMLFGGGDEGGQIDFDVARSNTSLTGAVTVDIFQNKFRIFESTGTNRGAYIDLTTAAAGVGTNLLYTAPVGSASITGIASFNPNDFGVAATGHVSLTGNVARTNSNNNFTAVQTFNNGLSADWVNVRAGITAGGAISIAALGSTDNLLNSSSSTGKLRISAVSTLAATPRQPTIQLIDADGDLGGLGNILIEPGGGIGALISLGSTGGSNATVLANGKMSILGGLSAQSLTVAAGATFSNRATFTLGLTTTNLWVGGGGATFSANASFTTTTNHSGVATFTGGITANGLWVGGQGATFNSNATFNNRTTFNSSLVSLGDLTADSLWVGGDGATFNSNVTFNNTASFVSGLTTQSISVAQGSTFNSSMTLNVSTGLTALTIADGSTLYAAFVNKTAANTGGLWLRDGIFQVGGSSLASGGGNFAYNQNTEVFNVFGYQYINNSYPYQSGRVPLRVNGGTSQAVPLFAAYVSPDNTQITNTYSSTNMVAGIDSRGALFTTAGISAAGGITLNSTIGAPYGLTFTSSVSIGGGVTANGLWVGGQGATFNSIATFNSRATALGGLSANSLWGGGDGATFNSRASAIGGLTSTNLWVGGGGATFNSPVSFNAGTTFGGTANYSFGVGFQNGEYIRNTTNGQMDFMPSPNASTSFGLYMDMTSWTFGVILGTIRSSDGAKNTGGNFRFDVPVTVNTDTTLQLGSDGQYGLLRTATGLDTAQLKIYSDGVNNSGAFALVGLSDAATTNRSPTTAHTNPNLYIYRNGNANAGDFMRMEHDGTVGRIASGATSGIELSPGRGTVSISGGISADSYVLSQNGIQTKTTAYSLTGSDNGKVIIFNAAAGVTATVPAGLPIGYSVTLIQVGAGQVTVTGPAGVTLNSYTGLIKIAGQHGSASVVSYQTNVYNLAGNLA